MPQDITAMVVLVAKMLTCALAGSIEALINSEEKQADKRPLVLVTMPRISVFDIDENYELIQEFILHEDDDPFHDVNII